MTFAERDEPTQAFRLDRHHETLRERVEVRAVRSEPEHSTPAVPTRSRKACVNRTSSRSRSPSSGSSMTLRGSQSRRALQQARAEGSGAQVSREVSAHRARSLRVCGGAIVSHRVRTFDGQRAHHGLWLLSPPRSRQRGVSTRHERSAGAFSYQLQHNVLGAEMLDLVIDQIRGGSKRRFLPIPAADVERLRAGDVPVSDRTLRARDLNR